MNTTIQGIAAPGVLVYLGRAAKDDDDEAETDSPKELEELHPPLLARKSVLMGITASVGALVAGEGKPLVTACRAAPIDVGQSGAVLTWTPSMSYPAGHQLISPNNDVASTDVAHTSSATYAAGTRLEPQSYLCGR